MRRARHALLLAALAPAVLLAGCGRAGPPRQPGPKEAITYPRSYPAPDPTLRAPTTPAAPTAAPVPPAASLMR